MGAWKLAFNAVEGRQCLVQTGGWTPAGELRARFYTIVYGLCAPTVETIVAVRPMRFQVVLMSDPTRVLYCKCPSIVII